MPQLEAFKGAITSMQDNVLFMIIVLCMMIFPTITDLAFMKIYNKFNLIACLARFVIIPWFPMGPGNIVGGIVLFSIFLAIGMVNTKHKIGGDIKYAGVVGIWVGFYVGIMAMFIAMALILPVALIFRKPTPLAPFIHIGMATLFVLSFVI